MKRYFSVLMLAAGSTIYKISGLLLLMAALETASFYRLLQIGPVDQFYALESLIDRSGIPLICGFAFLGLCLILSLTGYESGRSKISYTLQRLSLREETIALLWSGYYLVCFLIFWAVQLLIVLCLSRLYIAVVDPAYLNEQTVFLAFFRNDFLRSLLPLEETSRLLRNGALLLSLSLGAACFPLKQRRGKRDIAMSFLAVFTFWSFPQEMGRFGSDAWIFLLALALAGNSAYYILWEKSDEKA